MTNGLHDLALATPALLQQLPVALPVPLDVFVVLAVVAVALVLFVLQPVSIDTTAIALGIVAGVVGLAALEYLPIMVSALAGVVAMLFSGILRPADAYEAVDWNVIFLLATFYLGTAIITEMVSNNASIVLMLPIAVEVAGQLGVNAFAFALAVTFAASTPLSARSAIRRT